MEQLKDFVYVYMCDQTKYCQADDILLKLMIDGEKKDARQRVSTDDCFH